MPKDFLAGVRDSYDVYESLCRMSEEKPAPIEPSMNQSVLVELSLPSDWQAFRMPEALQQRLQDLLDEQDRAGKLNVKQRKEATALTELAEMLTLMKLRAEVAARRLGA